MMMNTKLNKVIKAEIGADNGSEMPDVKGISRVLKVCWISVRERIYD